LHVLLVGENPASAVYVAMKIKRAEKIGIKSHVHRFSSTVTQSTLSQAIADLNANPAVDGILLQLPLPDGLNAHELLNAIDPSKDVDGLHSVNMGRLMQGKHTLAPCTPLGCMQLIHQWKHDLAGLCAVVVGRSNLVGLPLSLMLLQAGATVTICHSKTSDLVAHTLLADIVVVACGRPGLVTAAHIKPGACVIDVGINRLGDGTLVGDVDFASVAPIAGAITPVPGGVGPMTVYNLMANTLRAFKSRV
jgi:methylenetetrahydrofolate dehydrogenase (NADP+)/methenyltetrahydrofolate cyclohydrolase